MPEEGGYDEDPYAEDWGLDDAGEPTPPYWFPGQHLPPHARAMGLTHHVPDGALLDFAGSLDASKPRHLVTAWVMLAIFTLPVVFAVLRLFYVF
jgi:hypothetical protein